MNAVGHFLVVLTAVGLLGAIILRPQAFTAVLDSVTSLIRGGFAAGSAP